QSQGRGRARLMPATEKTNPSCRSTGSPFVVSMKALGQTGAAKRRKSLMRYMMIVKMTPAQEATLVPTDEDFATMGKYNDELIDAGVLLAAEGLQPSAMGFKVRKAGGKPHIVDGPFTETKELVAG